MFAPRGDDAFQPDVIDCEDPHLYRTDRGVHIVCHRRALTTNNPWNYSDVGGYGVSADGIHWRWSPTPIYTTTLPWADGGAAGAPLTLGRRERPEMLLGADGRPEFLTNGVELVTDVIGFLLMSILMPLGPPDDPPPAGARFYSVAVSGKSPTPVPSSNLPVGAGHSPCNLTYNPAFLRANPPYLNTSIVIVRASGCPPGFGGTADHLLYAECGDDGVCGDVQPLAFPFEYLAEDARVFFDARDEFYYLFYFANGTNQPIVFLRRTRTPQQPASWELLLAPSQRNVCALVGQFIATTPSLSPPSCSCPAKSTHFAHGTAWPTPTSWAVCSAN